MMLKPSPSSPSHPSARASLLNKMSLSSSGPTAPGSSPSLMAVTTPPGYKRAGTGLMGFLSDRVVGAIAGTERRCFPSEAIPRLALPRVEGAARQRCGRPSARVRFHPAGVIGRAVRPRLLRHEGNRRGSDVRTIAIAQKEAPDAGRATPLLPGLGGAIERPVDRAAADVELVGDVLHGVAPAAVVVELVAHLACELHVRGLSLHLRPPVRPRARAARSP